MAVFLSSLRFGVQAAKDIGEKQSGGCLLPHLPIRVWGHWILI